MRAKSAINEKDASIGAVGLAGRRLMEPMELGTCQESPHSRPDVKDPRNNN